MFSFSMGELLIVMVVALAVFGPAKLPEIGKSIGRGIKDFKEAATDIRQDVTRVSALQDGVKDPEKAKSN